MARVGRLAGAILAESNGEYFLVGNTKSPCDWAAAGFAQPVEIDPARHAFVRLSQIGAVVVGSPHLVLALEGEALAKELAQRFVIERNGSVSDRLWRLVLRQGVADADQEPEGPVDARWLGEIPAPIWQIVRDTVLRCT